MAVQDTNTIDSIFRDPKTDEVLLVMVEHRDWGQRGELLPDLQDKINAYLNFALGGQLANYDPTLKGKPLHIQLSTVHAPTARETQFFDILCSQVLTPRGIRFSWELVQARQT